jgi:hypothetical protein
MKRGTRLLSGVLTGASLLSIFSIAQPAAAAPAGSFCDETATFICCCTTYADGSIQSCNCQKRPIEAT